MTRLFSRSGRLQERAVERRRAADHDMIAAAGPGVLAVDHEFVGAEPRKPRLFIDRLGRRHAFAPVRGGMDVHLDHAGVGRDADHVEAGIDRGRIALDMHRQPDPRGRGLGRRHQFEVVLQPLDRRQEDAEAPVPRLDRDGRPHRSVDVAEALLDPLLARLRRGERGDPLGAFPLRREIRQRPARLGRVGFDDIGKRRRRHIGQRAERQAVADGAVARREIKRPAPRLPFLAAPVMARRLRLPALDRQNVTRWFG